MNLCLSVSLCDITMMVDWALKAKFLHSSVSLFSQYLCYCCFLLVSFITCFSLRYSVAVHFCLSVAVFRLSVGLCLTSLH